MVKHYPALVVIFGALASAACVVNLNGEDVLVREQKRFTLSGDADLTLDTFDGSIQLRSWDRNEVLVEIEKRGPSREEAAALEVRATQDGNRIRVEAPKPRIERERVVLGTFNSPSVSLIVSVPRRLTAVARTGDGSITAEDLSGRIELRTGDGSIRGDRIEGNLTAHTGDGSLTITDVSGRVAAASGDGSIHVDGRIEDLRVETGDGSVVVEADNGSALKNDWTVTTGDGSIVFRVPSAFDAEIEAESGDGSVRGEGVGLIATRTDDDRESLRGRLGRGGHIVKLRSGDGSIRIVSQ